MKQSHIAEGFANYFGHLLFFGREFAGQGVRCGSKDFQVRCRLHIKNNVTSNNDHVWDRF